MMYCSTLLLFKLLNVKHYEKFFIYNNKHDKLCGNKGNKNCILSKKIKKRKTLEELNLGLVLFGDLGQNSR